MESLKLDGESLIIKVGVVEMPAGGRGLKITNLNKESPNNSLKKKTSCVNLPYDEENLCCARSLVICREHKLNLPEKEWKKLTRKRNYMSLNEGSLRQQAIQLQTATGIPIKDEIVITHLPKFEEVMNARIVVFASNEFNEIIYPGGDSEKPTTYFLYFQEEEKHYVPILSIAGFLGSCYFCMTCLKPYDHKNRHKCFECCKVCKDIACDVGEAPLSCRTCNRECRSLECFQRHKSIMNGEKSLCETVKRCLTCKAYVNITKRDFAMHVHGENYCKPCGVFYANIHSCYIHVAKPKKTSGVFYYFDFEATMEEKLTCFEGYAVAPHPDCGDCNEKPCRIHSKCNNCKRIDCGVPKHKVNYVVCQSQCDACADKNIEDSCAGCGTRCRKCASFESKTERVFVRRPCNGCGKRQTVFEDIDSFGEFVFQEYHYGTIFISHNGGRYDNYFLLDYVIKNSMKPTVVFAASRIMMMQVQARMNIKFLDSFSFLPMALKKLPKAFGLQDLEKGDFPYFFNTEAHRDYKGEYPPAEMYGVDTMSPEARLKFLNWHRQQSGTFDMQKQIHKYCVSDVTILREACTKFRTLMFSITKDEHHPGVDVFSCVTIASVCMNIFQSKFLEQEYDAQTRDEEDESILHTTAVIEKGCRIIKKSLNTEQSLIDAEKIENKINITSAIARVPVGGYIHQHGVSKVALEWLEWMSLNRGGIHIRHAGNGREVMIDAYKVDGFYEGEKENVVYEFHGCVFHGHSCIKDRQFRNPFNNKTMAKLLAETAEKERRLKECGYKVVSIWECQWREMVKQNPVIQELMKKLDVPERLIPRDAFFGGRTCSYKLHHKVEADEEIRYYDFTRYKLTLIEFLVFFSSFFFLIF